MSRIATRRALAAVALAGLLATAGCSGSGSSEPQSSTLQPGQATGTAALSPSVVAASAVGSRSRAQIVSLHDYGVSTAAGGGVPHTELPRQGAMIRSALTQQVAAAIQLPPPVNSPAARLVTSLRTYADLAGRLAAWNPKGAALPAAWFTQLRANDVSWRSAMTELSRLSGHDLLAGLPVLKLPAS